MTLKTSLPALFVSSCLFCAAGLSYAQSAPSNSSCPTLPAAAMSELQWVILRTDSALLCRAVSKDSGNEAFALTMSRKSPFKPDSSLRAEQGQIEGKKLWWYRAEIAGRPDALVRETLIKTASGGVVHAFIRTDDSDTLTRYQQMVQTLEFAAPSVAAR
jgi:hypothetical protein